ncbi:MAPEG family protein [Neisseria bacilliformis]|uniref:MAPEG family protein n=1 Tax=Neisseria bacilliformis TaxID=267212 RepID=UPI0028E360F9|nr:MAPEG family protein [Neisseria bacilliformis]
MTLAYWCVLFAALLPIFCAMYAKKRGGFDFKRDNGNPRAFLAQTEGAAARANAAQQNGYETFAPFAAAVIIAHATGGASQAAVNFWAVLFVISRILFCLCYIAGEARLRSAVWGVGFVCIIALFIAAV